MSKDLKTEPVSEVVKFDLATLRKDSLKLFGVTTSTFDGAMYGKTGPYSVAEANDIIQRWGKEKAE